MYSLVLSQIVIQLHSSVLTWKNGGVHWKKGDIVILTWAYSLGGSLTSEVVRDPLTERPEYFREFVSEQPLS